MNPRSLKRWLIVAAVVYLLLPRDLIPDFLGRGLGFVDDLALMGGMLWYYRKKLRGAAEPRSRHRAEGRAGSDPPGGSAGGPRPASSDETTPDAHAVLGVPRSASQEEIRAAYRARMREYHPDKVSHLGEELQELAHRKSLEIQRAFEELRDEREVG